MEENSKTLILILFALIVVLFGFLGISSVAYPEGFNLLGITPESSYDYEVTILATEPIYNVTLFLPLPSRDSNSPAGFSISGGEGYGVPENMVTEVFGEGDSLFLKTMVPELVAINFGTSVDGEGVIDTIDPIKNSYVLSPVKQLNPGTSCDEYSTYIFASYDSSPDAVVKIRIKETGKNQWKGISEKSNMFTDEASLIIKGPSKKWHSANVSLNKRIGDYSIFF